MFGPGSTPNLFGYLVNVAYPVSVFQPHLAVQKIMCSSSGVGAPERFFSFWEGAEDEEAVDVLFTDGSMVEDRGSLCCNVRWIDSISGIWT